MAMATNKRPLVFRLMAKFYVKVDNHALEIDSASCLCEAVSFLLKIHYALDLSMSMN